MLAAFSETLLQFLQQFASQIPAETLEQIRKGVQPSAGGLVQAIGLNLVLGPPIWILVIMVFGVIQHGLLTLVGGAKYDLETSLKACFYAGGLRFWEIIPLANWISLPWVLTAQSIGLAKVHETDGWKGAVAGWGPAFGCCCCMFGFTFAVGFLGAVAAA
jgi:hypothetical protein